MKSVFYKYFQQCCNDFHTAPTSCLREIIVTQEDDTQIHEFSAGSWSYWKKGGSPQKEKLRILSEHFDIPMEALFKGPTAYKVLKLIETSCTNVGELSNYLGISESELNEHIQSADKDSFCYDNSESFANFFDVSTKWMKNYYDINGEFEEIPFFTKNRNEQLSGVERLEREVTNKILHALFFQPNSIVLNDGRKTIAFTSEDIANYQLAIEIIEVFNFAEISLLEIQTVIEQYKADKALSEPKCAFAQIACALSSKMPCILIHLDSKIKIVYSTTFIDDMQKAIQIIKLLPLQRVSSCSSDIFRCWLSHN